jgi:plastocyanin
MKRRTTLFVAIAALLLLPAVASAADTTIDMQDIEFKPPTLTVAVGDSVTWVNKDAALHDAIADDGSWKTPTLNPNQSASLTFSAPGTYAYHCSLHGSMRGTLTVVETAPNTDTVAPASAADTTSPLGYVCLIAGMAGLFLATWRFRRATLSR